MPLVNSDTQIKVKLLLAFGKKTYLCNQFMKGTRNMHYVMKTMFQLYKRRHMTLKWRNNLIRKDVYGNIEIS